MSLPFPFRLSTVPSPSAAQAERAADKQSTVTEPLSAAEGGEPLGPEAIEAIGRRWLRGESMAAIGESLGVTRSAIGYHIRRTLRPMWREKMAADLEVDLAKVEQIELEAWRRYRDSGGTDLDALEWVKWAIEHRAKIFGSFAPAKHKIEMGELRVAGMDREQLDAAMMERLADLIEQRRLAKEAAGRRGEAE